MVYVGNIVLSIQSYYVPVIILLLSFTCFNLHKILTRGVQTFEVKIERFCMEFLKLWGHHILYFITSNHQTISMCICILLFEIADIDKFSHIYFILYYLKKKFIFCFENFHLRVFKIKSFSKVFRDRYQIQGLFISLRCLFH